MNRLASLGTSEGEFRKDATMETGHITDSLKNLMMRQDMRRLAAGTAKSAERDAGRSLAKGALPPIGCELGGQQQPIRIAWNNTNLRQSARSTASLNIVGRA